MQSVCSTNGKRCFCLVQCVRLVVCSREFESPKPESLPVLQLEMAISCRLGEAIRFVKPIFIRTCVAATEIQLQVSNLRRFYIRGFQGKRFFKALRY